MHNIGTLLSLYWTGNRGAGQPYSGTCFATTRQTDIEHIVATSEAHDSGLCAASARVKAAFATDLLNLTLASPTVNRYPKSTKDLAEWTPSLNSGTDKLTEVL